MLTLSSQAVRTRKAISARTDVRLFKMMLEHRDRATALHCIRVAKYAAELASRMSLSQSETEKITRAALLHDIGKLATPVNDHAVIGARLVSLHEDVRELATLIRHHHERYDGSGYPYGLARGDIPLGARIIAVADSFDAMTAGRRRQRAISVGAASAELKRCAGSQFDPEIVAHFATPPFYGTTARGGGHGTVFEVTP